MITLTLSENEAKYLVYFCHWVGGCPDEGHPRAMFDHIAKQIKEQIADSTPFVMADQSGKTLLELFVRKEGASI